MSNAIYQFLDDLGTQEFINVVMEASDNLFQDKIVTELDDSATDEQFLSAKAVLAIIEDIKSIIGETNVDIDAILEILKELYIYGITCGSPAAHLTHLSIEVIIGDINEKVPEPRNDVFYFQKDDENDETWVMYVNDGSWKVIGETKYVLEDYWRKDELEDLLQSLMDGFIGTIPDEDIIKKVKDAFDQILKGDWEDSTVPGRIIFRDGELIIQYDSDQPAPDIRVSDDGELILNSNGSEIDTELEKYRFRVNENDELIMRIYGQ